VLSQDQARAQLACSPSDLACGEARKKHDVVVVSTLQGRDDGTVLRVQVWPRVPGAMTQAQTVASAEGVLAQVRDVVDAAYPVEGAGSLFVSGAPAGAVLFVDGVARGTLPLPAPVDKLAAGRRHVEVRAVDHQAYDNYVDVKSGALVRLDLDVDGKSIVRAMGHPAALSSSSLWTIVAVSSASGGLVGLAGGSLLLSRAWTLAGELQRTAPTKAKLQDAQLAGPLGVGLLSAGGVLLIVGAGAGVLATASE
jgi:hypothetical protein